jgi:hypothetical protein
MHVSGGSTSVNYVDGPRLLFDYNELGACFEVVCKERENGVACDEFGRPISEYRQEIFVHLKISQAVKYTTWL